MGLELNTSGNTEIPVGYYGQIEILGIVIFAQGKACDTHIGQYMSPQIDDLIKSPRTLTDATKIHPYR